MKAYGGFPELEKQVYDLKACTVMEVASAVPIVQNVVISAVVKTAVEQAKAQEKGTGTEKRYFRQLYKNIMQLRKGKNHERRITETY